MDDIAVIRDYILYLKEHTGLSITLHPIPREGLIMSSDLRTFNVHDVPFCIYIKTSPKAFVHCVERQQKIMDKCRGGSFCGTCYAGVTEYVYPFGVEGHQLGFISVGGYRSESPESYIKRVSELYDIPEEELRRAYASLRPLPPKSEIDVLLRPLVLMLEMMFTRSGGPVEENSLVDRIMHYVQVHHTEPITSEDIAAHFYCSRSHFAHLFKKKTGMSLPQFINYLRIEDAKVLLAYSNIDIAEIACAVGMGDRNWFSTVFRRMVGVSPRAYRSAHRSGVQVENVNVK